jgi:hypothetical protein
MIKRRGTVGVLVSMLAIGLLAGTASAKKKPSEKPGGIFTRAVTSQGSGNQTIVSAIATCPKKAGALTGGFTVQPFTSAAVNPLVYESQRVGARAWRSSAQISDTNAPAETVTLTATVSCRRNAPKLTTTSAQIPTPPSAPAGIGPTATAQCPVNRKALSGGFLTSPPIVNSVGSSNFVVLDSYRADSRTWATRLFGGGTAGTLATYAYCARARKLPFESLGPGGTTSASLGSAGSLAACGTQRPGGPKPVGGGFSQTAVTDPFIGFFAVQHSAPRGDQWDVAGTHLGAASTTLTSRAYCAR